VPRLATPALAAALMALTAASYLPVCYNGFVDIDDDRYITANPRVTEGLTPEDVGWAWTTFHGNYWQPLSWLSLQLDAQLFSAAGSGGRLPRPGALHAESVCWHAASAALLFGLWQRLTGARWRSFFAAALFAVHPMRVESVAWAAERKDVLSVFFGVLTLWAYALYLEAPSRRRYLGVAAAYALSLLAKPMLMTLPFVLLLLDYWPLRRAPSAAGGPAGAAPAPWGRLVLEKVPLFVLAAGIAVVTAVARDRTASAVPLSELPVSDRLANAAAAYGAYLVSTFYPVRLAVLYPHPGGDWPVAPALAGAGALAAMSLLAWRQAARRPWLLVGWLWFVVALLPVIGLAQGGPQARADRFCYWPHVGLFVAVAWGAGEVVERWRVPAPVTAVAAALVIGWLCVLTRAQAGYWHDPKTLWEHALDVTDRNAEAHRHLGNYYLQRGQPEAAESHFSEADGIKPGPTDGRHTPGPARSSQGKT
jgi:hypothetical protein